MAKLHPFAAIVDDAYSLASTRDDPSFVAIVAEFVTGILWQGNFRRLQVVHVDRRFSARFLKFTGKPCCMMGWCDHPPWEWCNAPVPPFYPGRIMSERTFVGAGKHWEEAPLARLHGWDHGKERLLRKDFSHQGVSAWYASDTKNRTEASIIVYALALNCASGCYVRFKKNQDWTPTRFIGLDPDDWQVLCARGQPTVADARQIAGQPEEPTIL